jgi:hypothetical protein
MNTKTDFSDALADDFLRETATRFFGNRKQLEDMISAFEESVDELRKKEALVVNRAGLLHFILLKGEAAAAFYTALGVDAAEFASETTFTAEVLPEKVPFAINRRQRYIKLVLLAYDALQKEAHIYMHGRYYNDPELSGRENVTIHYRQIETMAELINETVEKINRDMSPVCTLQYARRFHPEMEAMERITGSGGEFGDATTCSIDQKLAYQPVDFNSLKLKSFPDMPPVETVTPVITGFAKQLYREHQQALHDIMDKMIEDMKSHKNRNPLQ